ncbi:type VII toxin-antitoxin system MntA family adenylyltransferase antitoxin [Halomonas getboli]|uniref:type VII toxin-antitoxin system MntA family adenylyltransferase antitoxin n=1 Tax=Halomonas getboli TaxID=2935862 RepID=UPI001FFF4305|nr:nucleotidyltransferase domain-containing protein [Halomonas getboli]MCK2183090.1 nucleotidyltransferase domain-containing protein [Halomonas getboli]
MPLRPEECQRCVESLRQALPALQAVYLFGSQATEMSRHDSDVDLAVLLPLAMASDQRWALAGTLASLLDRDVDLVDLRDASTVMQYQVVSEGAPLWRAGTEADEFELAIFSEYWDLGIKRRVLMEDIKRRESIYGR